MKKLLCLMILGLFVMSMVGVVSANPTMIGGAVTDGTDLIGGAYVKVTCNETEIIETETNVDGYYSVVYSSGCVKGNDLSVYAEKKIGEETYSGTEPGVVSGDEVKGWNITIMEDVTIPEFTLFIGALTLLGAVGIFFFVRR